MVLNSGRVAAPSWTSHRSRPRRHLRTSAVTKENATKERTPISCLDRQHLTKVPKFMAVTYKPALKPKSFGPITKDGLAQCLIQIVEDIRSGRLYKTIVSFIHYLRASLLARDAKSARLSDMVSQNAVQGYCKVGSTISMTSSQTCERVADRLRRSVLRYAWAQTSDGCSPLFVMRS